MSIIFCNYSVLCRGSRDGSLHLHGDSIADLKFPAKVSKKLVKVGYMYLHIMLFQNLVG